MTFSEWRGRKRRLLYANSIYWGCLFLFKSIAFSYICSKLLRELPCSSGALLLEGLILLVFIIGVVLLSTARKVADFMANKFKPSDARWAKMCQKHP
jgi:hypothetical protein